MKTGSVIALGIGYFVIENVITFTVINGIVNYEKKDDPSIRTKVPNEKPKLKIRF